MRRGPEISRIHRPTGVWVLAGILGFIGIGGLVTGPLLIADPTGAVIGARVSWLEATPVPDWSVVGWFLVVVMGVVPSTIALGLVTRFSWPLAERVDISRHEHWSWFATQVMGAGLLVWIALQFALIDLHGGPQPLFAVLGAALLALPWLPSVRDYLATPAQA
jgi:uncharacterized membrane protein YeaQ/YmgE (transglycosylase-associated protein family)